MVQRSSARRYSWPLMGVSLLCNSPARCAALAISSLPRASFNLLLLQTCGFVSSSSCQTPTRALFIRISSRCFLNSPPSSLPLRLSSRRSSSRLLLLPLQIPTLRARPSPNRPSPTPTHPISSIFQHFIHSLEQVFIQSINRITSHLVPALPPTSPWPPWPTVSPVSTLYTLDR